MHLHLAQPAGLLHTKHNRSVSHHFVAISLVRATASCLYDRPERLRTADIAEPDAVPRRRRVVPETLVAAADADIDAVSESTWLYESEPASEADGCEPCDDLLRFEDLLSFTSGFASFLRNMWSTPVWKYMLSSICCGVYLCCGECIRLCARVETIVAT